MAMLITLIMGARDLRVAQVLREMGAGWDNGWSVICVAIYGAICVICGPF
jgi:hypothetical protein